MYMSVFYAVDNVYSYGGWWTVLYTVAGFFFFFSSRRRHTRCSRDWSSDVCSSDLVGEVAERAVERLDAGRRAGVYHLRQRVVPKILRESFAPCARLGIREHGEIGRASCRERV